MDQKKCLNCLCMSDIDVKVCPYCKTPFKSGRITPVPLSNFKKNFNPPSLVTDEQKRFAKITRNIQTFNLKQEEVPSHETPAEADISNIIKSRVSKYSELLKTKDPFIYTTFTFDSLEIEEIKPEIKIEEEIIIDGVNVDPESLRELTDFALTLSPQETVKEKEVLPLKEEKKVFENKSVIRTSEEQITQNNGIDTNMGTRNVLEALESVSPAKNDTNTETNKPVETNETVTDNEEETALVRSNEHLRLLNTASEMQKEKIVANIPESASLENTLNTRPPQSTARGTTNNKALEHYSTARMLCVQGNYAQALDELELSVKLDPAYEQAHILLSRTYLKLKND